MKRKHPISAVLLVACIALAGAQPTSAGTKEQLIELQTTIQVLQDNLARMQQSFDERMGVIKDLITQQTDNVNRMSGVVGNLQKSFQQQDNGAVNQMDQVSGQVQALHDSVDELKARLEQISTRLDNIRAALENITSPPGGSITAANTSAGRNSVALPPDVLYNNALGDYSAGKNDLAAQEFTQFLQVYPNNPLAGNAQFYLGETDYQRNNFEAAVQDYDKVLDQYSGGDKDAAAQLKKGFALLDLGQKAEGVRQLRSVIGRYPKSPEAVQAKDRLHKIGVGMSKNPRPSPRHR